MDALDYSAFFAALTFVLCLPLLGPDRARVVEYGIRRGAQAACRSS